MLRARTVAPQKEGVNGGDVPLRGESDSDCRAVASFIFPSLTRNGCPGRGRLNDAALPQLLDLRVAGGSPADPRTLLGSRRSGRCGCCKLTSMLGLTCNFVNSETLCPMKSVGTVPLSPARNCRPDGTLPCASRRRRRQSRAHHPGGDRRVRRPGLQGREHGCHRRPDSHDARDDQLLLRQQGKDLPGGTRVRLLRDPPRRRACSTSSTLRRSRPSGASSNSLSTTTSRTRSSSASSWPRTRPRDGTSGSRKRCAL